MIKKNCFNPERFNYNARKVYGIIITLSIIISLEHEHARSIKIILLVLGALFAIALAEIYVKFTAKVLQKKQKLEKEERRELFREEFSIMFAANIPVLIFFLEIFNLICIETAFFLAKAFSIASLFVYGYMLGVVLEKPFFKKVFTGFMSTTLGFLIILLKLFFK